MATNPHQAFFRWKEMLPEPSYAFRALSYDRIGPSGVALCPRRPPAEVQQWPRAAKLATAAVERRRKRRFCPGQYAFYLCNGNCVDPDLTFIPQVESPAELPATAYSYFDPPPAPVFHAPALRFATARLPKHAARRLADQWPLLTERYATDVSVFRSAETRSASWKTYVDLRLRYPEVAGDRLEFNALVALCHILGDGELVTIAGGRFHRLREHPKAKFWPVF